MSQFLDEVAQLPQSLLALVAHYRGPGAEALARWQSLLRQASILRFAGMGTSEFAPLVARHRFAHRGVTAFMLDAGEWLHHGAAPLPGSAPTILISQSGESVEVKRLLERKLVPGPLVAITNTPDSTLGRPADIVLPLCAGQESAISTKTYTNTLALLHLLSAPAGDPDGRQALSELADAATRLTAPDLAAIASAAELLLPGDALAFIGRGPAFVSARQCALTFMEGTRCLASAFTGGAFRHGPFESCGPAMRAIFFIPDGLTRSLLEPMARQAAQLGSHVVILTDAPIAAEGNLRILPLGRVPGPHAEDLFPLIASATHPLLLHHLAARRGIEAGVFRYGQKVTAAEG